LDSKKRNKQTKTPALQVMLNTTLLYDFERIGETNSALLFMPENKRKVESTSFIVLSGVERKC